MGVKRFFIFEVQDRVRNTKCERHQVNNGFETYTKSARKYGKAGKTPRRLTVVGFLAQFKEEG